MHEEVRKGITQANFNKENAGLLSIEIFLLSILIGFAARSWWAFLAAITFLVVILQTPLGMLFIIILSIGWGLLVGVFSYVGWGLSASIVTGLFAFMVSMGSHLGGLGYYRDL